MNNIEYLRADSLLYFNCGIIVITVLLVVSTVLVLIGILLWVENR